MMSGEVHTGNTIMTITVIHGIVTTVILCSVEIDIIKIMC